MTPLRTAVVAIIALLISAPNVRAQNLKVVWVDFERAVVESAAGKKSSEKFNSTLQAKQADLEKRQKDLEDQQKKLQNGARTLSDAVKGDLQKDIDRRTRELQRLNEDAQKELQAMRDELLRPIAERASALLNAMAAEQNYTLVVDVSNQESNVVWANPKNDVTPELIKRIDAAAPADAPKAEAPRPATPAPTGVRPPSPVVPRPTTPAAPPPAPKPQQ
jgi:Skp family chaperone for outer membrane proteins